MARVLKPQIVKLIRCNTKKAYTNEEIADMLDTYAGIIREQMLAGNEIFVDGVGKFFCKHIEAHEARNPSNGETVQVAEHYKPRFGFSPKLTMELRQVDPSSFCEQEETDEDDGAEEEAKPAGRRVLAKKSS